MKRISKWLSRHWWRSNSDLRQSDRAIGEDSKTTQDEQPVYSADQPIRSKAQDRFNRWGFAERIAETLANRKDPSSIVIGIYGPWGDGKSSTLYLMEESLSQHSNVVRLKFNPWHFDSQEQLLRGFFASLADALGKSLPTKGEAIGHLLKEYGAILSIASVNFTGVQLALGDAAKGLGNALSTVTLDELRTRLEKHLREQGKRIVVLIDDIDRLDRSEIQAIFRLIKLSASFDYTSYVLAFDDTMVAAALGERYGEGNIAAGRAFLEKIVQVPLNLPPASQISLRKLTFEAVESALQTTGITLSQQQAEAFVRHFIDGLESRLTTPRQAKLYVNTLQFALPVLKGEVHPVDQMLIEGIRIFYPKLYATIRDNPEYFLNAERGSAADNKFRERATALIDNALDGIGLVDKRTVRRRLLEVLFPRLQNVTYGSEWDKRWDREQRICATGYFPRYFSYGVPLGDISDFKINEVIAAAASGREADLAPVLSGIGTPAMSRFISKTRLREDTMEINAIAPLAIALARSGSLLSRENQMLISDWTFLQAAILIKNLVRRIPTREERDSLARRIIAEAEPLAFAFECLKWLRKDNDQAETARVVSVELEEELGASLADRIRSKAAEMPLYKSDGADAPRLLWIWNKYGASGEVESYLRKRFELDASEVDDFLATYIGKAWGMESGLSHVADFDRGNFDSVATLVAPEFIIAKLKERYGVELDSPEYHQSDDVPIARRIAHQFAVIYRGIEKEKQTGGL